MGDTSVLHNKSDYADVTITASCDDDALNQTTRPLNIVFTSVGYKVDKGTKTKTILNDLNGTIKAGQLTAILGPSGAGKTSLMNILAGLNTSGVTGSIAVNGYVRDLKTFRKRSAYITQKDHLLHNLTVGEYIDKAAYLKLGQSTTLRELKHTVEHALGSLGLADKRSTSISALSGGESKRLSIALELVNNPSVLFLDEPTSGLDSSSSLHCVALLRDLAKTGRTVVATIHQPSYRLLEYFDHVYIVTRGSCIYQGSVRGLVPFFNTVDLCCPSYHNPADFAMDVACGEYGNHTARLISQVANGRLIYQETPASSNCFGFVASSLHEVSGGCCATADGEDVAMLIRSKTNKKTKAKAADRLDYACPYHAQVAVLLRRTWLTIWREKMLTMLRFAAHVVVGVMMGLLYWGVGNDASLVFNNAGFLFFNQLFILFAAMMPTIVTFPLERQVLVREHLNHWYSLKAYYMAKTLADIPFQIVYPAIYLAIVYLMTGQPLSVERFAMLLSTTVAMSLIAQGIGLLMGAAFSIPVAVFAGPAMTIPFLLFSGFFVNLNAIPVYMRWIAYVSFMRYGFEGSMLAVYGSDRGPLDCPQAYCHFRYADKLLKHFDLEASEFYLSLVAMLVFFLVIRVAGYFVLRFRMRHIR